MKLPIKGLVILFILASSSLTAQVRLPAILGDHMMIQQQSTLTLWGWDNPNQQMAVTPSWSGQTVHTRSKSDGRWSLKVSTPPAGGPFEILIKGSTEVLITDILAGEVWLCSGQSNMEMPLEGWPGQPILGSEEAIAGANYPDMRLFTVTRKTSFTPLDDCEGRWVVCTPEAAAKFSATGYFYGRELHRRLKIPVGLIHSSWGGTPSEAWTSQEYISRIPYFHTSEGVCEPSVWLGDRLKKYETAEKKWLSEVGFTLPAEAPAWSRQDFDDSEWMEVEVPKAWKETGIGEFEGIADFRVTFKVPKRWIEKGALLSLGVVDEMDQTYINGVLVGSQLRVSDWHKKRLYEIPPGLLQKKNNVLAIRVANTSMAGGFTGEAADLKISPAGSRVTWQPLAGSWKARRGEAFANLKPAPVCQGCWEPSVPTVLYNGMIHPILNFTIKGAIWYQGESNRYDGELYKKIFPNMIHNWRNDFNLGDFPFYFVQIAPYTYRDKHSTGLLREAQEYTYHTVPNTGMVVTLDIGHLTNIHPPDKQTVGWRLAQWALNRDYGMDHLYVSGPLYSEHIVEGDRIRIFFTNTCGGLYSKDEELTCFTIAGADGKFYPAKARIDKLSVVVSAPEVTEPVAVRFAWESTDVPNLFNMARFPAAPFRTKEWLQ